MSVGVWDPGGQASEDRSVSVELLNRFAALEVEVTEDIIRQAGLENERWVMGQEAQAWGAAAELDNATLVHLARLFTRIEMLVPGWDAGKKSPVIPIVRLLKDRDAFEPELRKWIKTNTNNRYLPHGSAL